MKRKMAALVPSPVNDESLFIQLKVKLPRELGRAPILRGGQIDVAHLPIAPSFDVGAIRDDPGCVAERILRAPHWHRHLSRCRIENRLRTYCEGDGFAGQTFERDPGILFCVERSSIDRQQVFALLDVSRAAPEVVAQNRIVCRAIIDFVDAISATIYLEVDSQYASVLPRGLLAGGWEQEQVRGAELAQHFPDHFIKVFAARAAIKQLCVFDAHRQPVHATHLLVIKIVAVEPPGVVEYLTCLGAGVDLDVHAFNLDLRFDFLIRGRVDEGKIVVLPDYELSPIGRQLEISESIEHRLDGAAFLEIDHPDGCLAIPAREGENQLTVRSDREI